MVPGAVAGAAAGAAVDAGFLWEGLLPGVGCAAVTDAGGALPADHALPLGCLAGLNGLAGGFASAAVVSLAAAASTSAGPTLVRVRARHGFCGLVPCGTRVPLSSCPRLGMLSLLGSSLSGTYTPPARMTNPLPHHVTGSDAKASGSYRGFISSRSGRSDPGLGSLRVVAVGSPATSDAMLTARKALRLCWGVGRRRPAATQPRATSGADALSSSGSVLWPTYVSSLRMKKPTPTTATSPSKATASSLLGAAASFVACLCFWSFLRAVARPSALPSASASAELSTRLTETARNGMRLPSVATATPLSLEPIATTAASSASSSAVTAFGT